MQMQPPCEFPSLSSGAEHKESVFDLSTKPLHLTNIKFTSTPSIVSSGDKTSTVHRKY
jgi:hypothetical protein